MNLYLLSSGFEVRTGARLRKTPITITGVRTCTRNFTWVALNYLSGPLRDFTQVASLTILVSVHLSVFYATEIAGGA